MTRTFPRKLAGVLLNIVLVVAAGGFAAAALVRYSPGFDIDENAWSPRLSAATAESIRARNRVESRLPVFCARYVAAALHGQFGVSQAFHLPVSTLLKERAGISSRLVGSGALGGLVLSAALAWLAVWPRSPALALFSVSVNGLLIAVPPAVLALFFFFREGPLSFAIALAVMPRLFGTFRALLLEAQDSTAVLCARSRGLGPLNVALRYVLRPMAPQLPALAGAALVLAFGCIIPAEALCDVPGIGQLAWKAALARDLPLLSALALIVTFAVSTVHALGELAR